ncbi:hypothetical protein MKW98_006404 [Papaver atlanticum]|uniref:Uncharacterized protein n=1 Tax=Papaver atlanticum TaxID=357466 RepID=A0AAD4X3Y3_9MAGN|nr:hypothetical protein MKW98_006404 [Papaver atlanticum]
MYVLQRTQPFKAVDTSQCPMDGFSSSQIASSPRVFFMILHNRSSSLKILTELIPDKNRFTGSLPSTVGELGNLIELSIHGNSFSGNLPPGLKNLHNLVSVDLIMKLVSGNLPPSIGNLKRLIYLDASHNKFTGIIPQEL